MSKQNASSCNTATLSVKKQGKKSKKDKKSKCDPCAKSKDTQVIDGNVKIKGKLHVQCNTHLERNLLVEGNTELKKDLTVEGETHLKDLFAETITAGTINADEIFSGCEKLKGIIEGPVSIQNLCYTFDCNASVNIQDIKIVKSIIEPEGTLINPFASLPILTPSSDTKCPDPKEGEDPLVTATVAQDASFQIPGTYLIFTNNSELSPNATPGSSTGPWYFEKEPFSDSNKTVITVGCREIYAGGEGSPDDRLPPVVKGVGTSFSNMDLTFDQSMINPDIEELQIDLSYGCSAEVTYDFLKVISGDNLVLNVTLLGPSAEDPYSKGNIVFRAKKTDTVRIQFLKDYIWYGGVDSCYFSINKVTPVVPLEFPTTLKLLRGSNVIQDYTNLVDLDSQGLTDSLIIECPLNLQTGDQLCLTVDTNVYTQFDVLASYQNIPQIKDHKSSESFSATTKLNEISYNNRIPDNQTVPQGWYDTDSQFVSTQCFIDNIAPCGNNPGGLKIKAFSAASSGAFFLNNYYQSGPLDMELIGKNRYRQISSLIEYVYDPESGELRLDVSNPENIIPYGFGNVTIYRPIGNPDEKYWKYNFDLKDYNHQFNTPINFYDFVVEYFKSGYIGSLFGIKSTPTWPDINPLNLDQTQVKGSFGINTRQQYDNLARVIRDIGIERKYDIQRFIYWPQPGDSYPVLTEEQKRRLRWQVNQNRYPFLGFVTKMADGLEGEFDYPKLCPGETVTITGTGTRFDNFPLRTIPDGYHTGPKPTGEFMQTYSGVDPRDGKLIPSERSYDIHKEWAFYTMRLPITIDETNNKIYSQNGGVDYNGEFTLQVNCITNPVTALGPFIAAPTLFGKSIPTNPISGQVVVSNPLNAATLTTNIFNTSMAEDVTLPQPTLNVDSTAGFPSSGVISVETDDGFQDVTYTGITPTSFTGCSGGDSFTGVGYFVSKVVVLPQPVLEVNSTAGFPNSGRLIVYCNELQVTQTITYTGITPTSFTGCVGGNGRITTGDPGLSFSNYTGLSVPLTNAAAMPGKVALIQRGAIDFARKAYMALDAGATGVILYNTLNRPPIITTGPPIDIPTVFLSDADGTAIRNAVNSLISVTVDIQAPPVQLVTLPMGTYYLSDIYQNLYDQFIGFKSEFFIEVGNYLSKDIAVNRLFSLTGSQLAVLYGPNDANYPSNFFGPSGINTEYLWPNSEPLISEALDLDLLVGSYAQLNAGEYKTHTPLTSEEAQLLIDSVDNKTASVSAKHGPITLDMTYEKYVACINELSMSRGTEDHTIIHPWSEACDNGMRVYPESFKYIMDRLKQITLDPTIAYETGTSDPNTNLDTVFGPILYSAGMRATGTGHPGEFSEMYVAGAYRGLKQEQSRGIGRLDWIIPQERFFYEPGTIVPGVGDISNREVEIPLVNYLDNPRWLGITVNMTVPYVGAPDYYFIPFDENSSEYAETRPGTAPPVKDPKAVPGSWLVGTLKESQVRKILDIESGPVPGYGYITWYASSWGSDGDSTILPWYDDEFPAINPSGIAAAAKILQYFNSKNVKHIIIDVRNTVGGNDVLFGALASLVGDKRYFNLDSVSSVNPLEPNSINSVYSERNFQKARELAGVTTYKCNETSLDCNPDAYVNCGVLDVYPNGIWNGELTGQAAQGLTSNIIWLTNATTISATQFMYLRVKGTSLDGSEYDGDFGKSTRFVGYGVYYRPFSTGGGYISYINWWTKNRKGSEEVPNGLLASLDRSEGDRSAYLDKQVDGEGGILKGLDQDFSKYHQPHIKWDMNADVFFQDIGFTKDTPGVDPVLDGEPWLPKRYSDVDFRDPLTYRDTVLEKCVKMAVDPNLVSHFYVDDGYGYVSQLP